MKAIAEEIENAIICKVMKRIALVAMTIMFIILAVQIGLYYHNAPVRAKATTYVTDVQRAISWVESEREK